MRKLGSLSDAVGVEGDAVPNAIRAGNRPPQRKTTKISIASIEDPEAAIGDLATQLVPTLRSSPVAVRLADFCMTLQRHALDSGRLHAVEWHDRVVNSFAAGEGVWTDRLGNLRNVVRQNLISRQLANHLSTTAQVLDIGCGQGTQAIDLARSGCTVVGVDPSAVLLQRLAADARQAGVEVTTFIGTVDDLPRLLAARTFDVVCAHGLLMYLEDPVASLVAMTARVNHGGVLSVTFRNGSALAFRPGMRGQWHAALDALDQRTYVNELGVQASAQTLDQMTASLTELGFTVDAWYGVRVFTDPAPGEETPPAEPQLRLLLEAEYEASRRDPYRHLGSQIHLIARHRS